MSGRGERDGQDWTDLARNAPGIGISYEAARRRQADGVDTDRSWRVGADGEIAVAEVLAVLTGPARWDRTRDVTQTSHKVTVGRRNGALAVSTEL